MPMPLKDWQRRLERHFSQLAATRSNSNLPLFALEHDLKEAELDEIAAQLRSELALGLRLEPNWLLWVVYATELGYSYDGGEYWRSFEERTPRWSDRGSRNQLRDWFLRFQVVYQGVKPSGTWAGHFPIIAWPITHAILSKYLQWQFAKTLYDLRYRLAGLDALSPEAVGRLLAANAWDTSSRFREFLQQETLAGRIVLALLSDKAEENQSPVYPPTLQRLVADLDRVQSTQEWLKETRRFVADRFKGTSRGPQDRPPGAEIHPSSPRDTSADSLRIRPSLLLRPSGNSAWSAVIEIPSFDGIAGISPSHRAFLSSTRCKITGTGDTWLPKGWLVSTTRKRVLKSWPLPGVPLIKFERSNDVIEKLIETEVCQSSGPIWLFRIGNDGLAHEIDGRIVRPNREYIVVSAGETSLSDCRLLNPCQLACADVIAARLSVPDTLSNDNLAELQRLGLHVARTVTVWPAGLAARGWGGEGLSEWLTTEEPCFGIVHDHPVSRYAVSLNGGPHTLIGAREVGSPVFVKLPRLPAGSHKLFITVHREFQVATPAEGIVTLEVRPPEPWLPGTSSHSGLAISLDPYNPSLDMFWNGEVEISVLGPAGHHVKCAVSLANASGDELLSEEVGTFDLPLRPAEWNKKFAQFANEESRSWTGLEAASGRFRINGGELGEYVLRLDRDTKPVRWVSSSINRIPTVRLIDDTDSDAMPICNFFSFRRPAHPVRLDTAEALAGFPVPVPGGLFEVQKGDYRDTIVVSVPQVGGGLQSLGIETDLHELKNDNIEVRTILDHLCIWSEARLLGPLVGLRRSRVTRRLLNCLYSRLCGKRWADAEALYLANSKNPNGLRQLEQSVGGSPGFAVILSRDYEKVELGTGPGTEWYADAAARYQVCSNKGLSEFSLQLASNPCHLLHLPKPVLDGLLLEITKKTILLRGARLVALLSASKELGFANIGLPRWEW